MMLEYRQSRGFQICSPNPHVSEGHSLRMLRQVHALRTNRFHLQLPSVSSSASSDRTPWTPKSHDPQAKGESLTNPIDAGYLRTSTLRSVADAASLPYVTPYIICCHVPHFKLLLRLLQLYRRTRLLGDLLQAARGCQFKAGG